MAEYIDRKKVEKKVLGLTIVDPAVAAYADAVLFILRHEPEADVAPVVRGRWVKRGCKWQCTHCKVLMSIEGTPKENLLNYCPNCGAKMRCDNEQE